MDQFFGFPEDETEQPIQVRRFNQMAGIIYLPGIAGTPGTTRQQFADFGQRYTGEMLRSRGPIESGGVSQSGTTSQSGFVMAVLGYTDVLGSSPKDLQSWLTTWGSSVRVGMGRSTATMPGSIHGAKTNMDGVIVDRGNHSVDSTEYIAEADCSRLIIAYPLDHESERSGTGYFLATFKLDDVDSGLTQASLESNVEMSIDVGLATSTGNVGDPIPSGNLFRITQRFWEGFGATIADGRSHTITGAAPNNWASELINSAIGTRANNVWRSVEAAVSFKGDNLA